MLSRGGPLPTPGPFPTPLDALVHRARTSPDAAAFLFEGRSWTYGEIGLGVDRFAAGLLRRGIGTGHRAVLAVPNGPEFYVAFFGAQRAGAVPVPVFPAASGERLLTLARRCEARAILLPSGSPVAAEIGPAARAEGRLVFEVGRDATDAGGTAFAAPRPEDLAYIQYTSGSTGQPKGVPHPHGHLTCNVRQMVEAMEITPEDVFVSWLPAYHDMGLVFMTLVPLYLGARLVLLRTELGRPERWLEAVAAHRGTLVAAPDFAYRMCLRYVRRPERFDLRSLRLALNASETVRASTVAGFESAFGLRKVVTAGYGLAEATVGVSTSPAGEGVTVDGEGRVSVGRPLPGIDVGILREGVLAGAGEIGEVVVRSPANMTGYLGSPAETGDLFWGDGFLRTGDLGALDASGNLTITGRIKEVIKSGGRTLAPAELEEVVEAVPGIRAAAAVGVETGDFEGEQVWVVAEVRPQDLPGAAEQERASIEVTDRLHRLIGSRPARVLLTRPGTIPRTANGKVQRARLREQVRDGALAGSGRVLFPE